MTILVGAVCALDLADRIRGKGRDYDSIVSAMITERLKETLFWGESATPFYWMCILAAEQRCNSALAEGLALRLVRDIAEANGDPASGRGFPNPYYSAEDALRVAYGLETLNEEQFTGFSYSVLTLINFLCSRMRRQALKLLWYRITRLNLSDYQPASAAEWLRWESQDGTLNSHLVDEPQSWEVLRRRADEAATDLLPLTLVKRPAFALWYLLVYPHRFTPAMAKITDDALRNAN